MARDWESQFATWAKPLGQVEQERCDNAAQMVRNAIGASEALHSRDIQDLAYMDLGGLPSSLLAESVDAYAFEVAPKVRNS